LKDFEKTVKKLDKTASLSNFNEKDIALHQEKIKTLEVKLDTKLNKEEVLVFKR
jgi:hypothetical protein